MAKRNILKVMQFLHTTTCQQNVFLSLIILTTIQVYIGYHATINLRYYKDAGRITSHTNKNTVTNSLLEDGIDQMTYQTNISTVEQPISTDLQKVFLFSSSPRSGSSYTSNILTAIPNTSYYFEPFWINAGSPSIQEVFNI